MAKKLHKYLITLPQENAVFGNVILEITTLAHEQLEAGNHLTQVLHTLGLDQAITRLVDVKRPRKPNTAKKQITRGALL